MQLSCGTILDNYRLLGRVGTGSCGTVWQAENIISEELVALKILSENELAERELRALKLYREINHPALIRIRHIGCIENIFFYTMDWCESSLAERRMNAKELLESALLLADGLAVLHEHGLLHRDIKPANILFRQGVPVLGDIGLLTMQKGATFAGSPGFLAPSLLNGECTADPYSDCYALAKTIYCALTGLEPEQFPLYTDGMTPEASRLMCTAIAVCSGRSSVRNARDFLSLLKASPENQKKINFPGFRISAAILVCVLIACGVLWKKFDRIKKPEHAAVPETKTVKKTEPERTYSSVREVVSEQTPAEKYAPPKDSPVQQQKKTFSGVKISVPAVSNEKKRRLDLAFEAHNLISASRQVSFPPEKVNFICSKMTLKQQNLYKIICTKINTVQASRKWKNLDRQWPMRELGYKAEIRKLEKEEGLDALQAMRKMVKNDPVFAFWVAQGGCQQIQLELEKAAENDVFSSFSELLVKFLSRSGDYIRLFKNIPETDYQRP